MASKSTLNLNKHWKNLDAIFQASLRKYVLSDNKAKFNELCQELGFDSIQSEFLFEAIQTFTVQCISTRNLSLSPYPLSANGHEVYAIPNNKNKQLKRRRSEIDTSDFDESVTDNDSDHEMPTKKRKIQTAEAEDDAFQTLWDNDAMISAKEQTELEEDGVYVVEEIVNHKQISDRKYQYNVKWVGYNDLTWEPLEHLNPSLVDEYWNHKGIIHDKTAASVYLNQRRQKLIKIKKKRKKEKVSKAKKKKKSHKKEKKAIEKEFKCIECNKVFKNGWALGGHNASKHKKKKTKAKVSKVYWEDSDAEDERDMLVCDDSD